MIRNFDSRIYILVILLCLVVFGTATDSLAQYGDPYTNGETYFTISGIAPPPTVTDVIVTRGSTVPGCETTNSCFNPFVITVSKGTKVTWYNDDTVFHTVTSGDLVSNPDNVGTVFDSSLFEAGSTFSHTFTAAGRYPYFCMVHPWMVGVVDVIGSQSPSTKYHDVSIILNWQKGSSDSSIKVKPKVTYDKGITLPYNYVDNYDYNFIEIYVNNQHKASVRPNQLSDNIYIGYGTYNIFAQSPEITDNTSGEVFTSSKSSVQSITLQPPIPGGTGSTITSSTSNTQDPTIFIILGVIAAVGGGVAVAMMKRKKPIPRTVPQDDTQIW